MHPLLTFASGLVVGIIGLRALKNAKAPETLRDATGAGLKAARTGLEQAETGLRKATVSGLDAIEKSSAALKAKLAVPETAAPVASVPPSRRKRAKTPRKPAARKTPTPTEPPAGGQD